MPASAAEREKRKVKPGKREEGEKIVFTSHERNQLEVKSFVIVHMWHLLLPFSDASSMCKVTPVSLSC